MEKKKQNRRPFFRFVKVIARLIVKKPKLEYLGETPESTCIYLSNHSGASGPANLELYLPAQFRMWGTHEMCGKLKDRWRYLNYTYYGQKKKKSKFMCFVLATVLTPILSMVYKGLQIIPTYPDQRLSKSIRISIEEFEMNRSVLIYPENSSDGYHDVLKQFHPGFWYLAKRYYEKTGKDIQICNMYFHRQSKRIIVGKPRFFSHLKEFIKTKEEAAKYFLEDTNNIYFNHILENKE